MKSSEMNQQIYRLSYDYLLNILPPQISYEKLQGYFVGDNCDFSSLEDIFEQLIKTAQNYQCMPNVIKYKERKDKIKLFLEQYDLVKISKYNIEDLYQIFRKEFNVKSADSNRNCWRKWSKSIIDAAKFMCDFKNVDDFKEFVSLFDYNLPTRTALPLLISTKISGIGFTLACDFLKELGYTSYPKPDVHLIDVFHTLGLSDRNQISVFEAVVRMSDDCMSVDNTITPYKVDKIIWLICSGNFYKDEIKIHGYKKDFIEYITRNISNVHNLKSIYLTLKL